MALGPENNPKEFLTIVIATGLRIFSKDGWLNKDCFDVAEKFVAEAEQRYGKLNP